MYVNVIRFWSSTLLKITLDPHEDSDVILKRKNQHINDEDLSTNDLDLNVHENVKLGNNS